MRFTVFNKSNTPAITNNRFTALYEDKDGTLWAGADQGEVVNYRNGVISGANNGGSYNREKFSASVMKTAASRFVSSQFK